MAAAFDIVSVRESASSRELNEACIACRRIPDLALYHEPRPAASRSGIAYTDCVVGPRALALYRRMSAAGAKPVNVLHDRRAPHDCLISLRRFLPGNSFLNPMLALAALRGVIVDWAGQTPDRDRFAAEVAAAQLIVTGRFHMLILRLRRERRSLSSPRTPTRTRRRFTIRGSGLGAMLMWERLMTHFLHARPSGRMGRPKCWSRSLRKAARKWKPCSTT